MFKRYLTLTLAVLMIGGLYGCDLLDTEPAQSVSPEVALSDLDAARAIVVSAYNRLHSNNLYGQRIMLAPDVLADNLILNPNTSSGRYTAEAANTPGNHVGGWGTRYGVINDANVIINLIDNLRPEGQEPTSVLNREIDRLKGEMYFLRGLMYFDLARIYAYMPNAIPATGQGSGWDRGVVMRTVPVLGLTEAEPRPRGSIADVYNLVQDDLTTALALLTNNERTGNERFYFANVAGINAILARYYLYTEDFTRAITHAEAAAAVRPLAQPAQVGNMFQPALNPESLFEVAIAQFEVQAGANESISAIATPAQWFDLIPAPALLSLYHADDARRGWWLTHGSSGLTYFNKFNQYKGTWTDHTPVIRTAELYLIIAESHLRGAGNNPAARQALDALRAARGLTPVSNTLEGSELLDEILNERRRELVYEGHRFFDLKRLGRTITKAPGTFSNVPFDDYRILAPIPSGDIQLSEGILQQNPGYSQ
jgi:hypothetical protein